MILVFIKEIYVIFYTRFSTGSDTLYSSLSLKDKKLEQQFEINKKQINAEVIQKEKTQEERSTTKKQIKNTKAILKLLEDDIKKVNYDENILLTKPDNSEKIISTIKSKILSNKDTIEKIELSLNTINNNLDLTTQKFQKLKPLLAEFFQHLFDPEI